MKIEAGKFYKTRHVVSIMTQLEIVFTGWRRIIDVDDVLEGHLLANIQTIKLYHSLNTATDAETRVKDALVAHGTHLFKEQLRALRDELNGMGNLG